MTVIDSFEVSPGVQAVVTQTNSISTIEQTIVQPKKAGDWSYVPWGDSDDLPTKIMEFVAKNEILGSNMGFNIAAIYGQGIKVMRKNPEGKYEEVKDPKIQEFIQNNDLDRYLLEQVTDLSHFFNCFPEIILDRAGKQILMINSKEATYSRWETMNGNTGNIDNHLYSAEFPNLKANKDNTEVTPVLEMKNPLRDLRVRMASNSKDKRFIIPINFPTPGRSYYQRPYWWSVFESGWYDISMLIPAYKKAMMSNQMTIKYHIQLHKDYFSNIFANEGITEKAAQESRKKTELENLKNYLSGAEKSGKTLISQINYSHEGKPVPMIDIKVLDNTWKGSEYLDDTDVASNMLCYAMNVHPDLIGAAPGKNGSSMSGTDKRELFTIKQALVRPYRNILLRPLRMIRDFNKWDPTIEFVIEDIALTTLDKGTDFNKIIQKP